MTTPNLVALFLLLSGCPASPAPASPAPPAARAVETSSVAGVAVAAPTPPAFLVPDQETDDGSYVVQVRRSFATEAEAELIRRAEAERPVRDVPGAVGAGQAWWFHDFDGVRIAWAVTDGALQYYVALVAAFRAADFSTTHGLAMTQASVKYEASVESAARFEFGDRVFENVRLVRLSLGWSQYCGGECAMGFHKERVVVFGADGAVQAVLLDGEAAYIVS